MSQAPSNNNNQQAQARAQAQAKQDAANAAQAKAFEKASTPTGNTGSGYGGGRVTFNSQGQRLIDNQLIVSNTQANRTILQNAGVKGESQGQSLLVNYADLQNARVQNSGFANTTQSIDSKTTISPVQDKSFGSAFVDSKLGTTQLERGSVAEDEKKQSEADRASKIYGSFSNSDFASGGKKSSDKIVVSLGKAQAFFGKTESGNYGWSDIGKNQLVRGSKQEEQVKQSEAEKAFTNSPSKTNTSYITGGTPDKTFGGPTTPQSKDRSAGWSILAPDQITRNSPKEEQVKQNEAVKALTNSPSNPNNAAYSTGGGAMRGLVDTKATKASQATYQFVSSGKAEAENALGNGLISLSNQQIAAKNISSDKEFRDYLHKGTEQGAVFSFFVGDKKVGETSGARSYHDFLEARQKNGNNVSVGENFPSREKTLSDAVQKNTPFYSNLPQSYWDALSKQGYFSEKNQGKINEQISLYGKTQAREALASGQGILPAIRFGGIIPTDKGPKVIGPEQNEVASFMKFPFAGQKVSTSFLKSTSYADILQFYPGVPGLGKALIPASEGWLNLIAKGQSKFGEIKTGLQETVRTNIAGKAIEGINNYPKPKPQETSLEARIGRTEPTFRPTNPTREKLPTDILSRDNAQGPTPFSARQNNPRNTFFEDITKDTQGTLSKSQNDLLKPRTPDTNPPASRNIPFFAGRKDPFGRLFSDNKPPAKPPKKPGNEAINVSGLTSGVSPIRTSTDTSTTGLSPTSSEFFGVQFQGSYPSSYLPPAAGQIGSGGARNVESDIFYRPARKTRNIELPFGEQPRESVSSSQGLLGARNNRVKENQSIFLSRTQNDLLVPTKKQSVKIISEKAPEESNPLGRRGKPPVKSSNPLDISQTPRSEYVERGRIRPENEVFTNKGQKIKNEYGDVLFGDLNKPQGALKSRVKSTQASKPIIDLEPQKDYQDWRFQKNAAKGPFNYGFRIGKPPKEVNLEPQKDYQDWRFANFLKKNPEPEKVGDSRFQSFVDNNLPKINKKTPVYSSVFKESKGKTFKSSSAKLFETKPKEESKGTEFKNAGSKQETVLLQKPLQKRRINITQEQQYDSLYEYKPIPSSKTDSSLVSGIMSGLKLGILPGYASKTGSLLDNLNKNLTGTKSRSGNIQTPKQIGRLFISQAEKQTPSQMPRFFQSPKQNTSPKQSQKQTPKMPTPQIPRSSLLPHQTFPVRTPTNLTNKNPKPKPIIPTLFGPVGRKRNGKSSSGPTGLINLNVNNIFASGLNINVGKNRVEF